MLSENTKTYFIRIQRNDQNHWDSQRDQRMMIFKYGISFGNIEWISGNCGDSANLNPTHLWKITCSEKQLTMVILKTCGIIEKVVDN